MACSVALQAAEEAHASAQWWSDSRARSLWRPGPRGARCLRPTEPRRGGFPTLSQLSVPPETKSCFTALLQHGIVRTEASREPGTAGVAPDIVLCVAVVSGTLAYVAPRDQNYVHACFPGDG